MATGKGANRHPQKDKMEYAQMDICNPEEVNKVLESFQPDVVIHTAAMTQVDDCEFEKEACVALNIDCRCPFSQEMCRDELSSCAFEYRFYFRWHKRNVHRRPTCRIH